MSSPRPAICLLGALLLASFACSRPSLGIARLRHVAIAPAAVLLNEGSAQWIGVASAIVLQHDLSASATSVPVFAADESNAFLASAAYWLQPVIERRTGKLRITAALFDLQSQRSQRVFESRIDSMADLLKGLDALAYELDSGARKFSTSNLDAMRLFTASIVSGQPQERAGLLRQAVTLDPNFGLAQLALVGMLGRDAMSSVATQGFIALDRARWDVLAVRLHQGSRQDLDRAESNVLNAAPNDLEALATLGSLRIAEGKRDDGIRFLEKAMEVSPQNKPQIQAQLKQLLARPAK